MLGRGGRKGLVGLDIGSHAIKAVELRSARNGFELVHVGHQNLQSDTIVDGHIIDLNHVSDVISRIWSEQQVKTPAVATALEAEGFWFAGVTPHFSPTGDRLRLIYLTEDLEIGQIHIAEEFGEWLVRYALADRKRLEG